MKKNFVIESVLIVILAVGCVKKRVDVEAQGSNISELTDVLSVDGLTCSLTTSKTKKAKKILNTEAVNVVSTSEKIKFLDALDYTTDCPYISNKQKEIEFRGELGKTYKIVFAVEPRNIVAYKLVSSKEISHYEKSYSKLNHGVYYVPFAYVQAEGFFRVEKGRDADQRETNIIVKSPVKLWQHKTATHVYIDPKGFDRFRAKQKVDVFPKDYFEGEWYLGETVIKKRVGANSSIGYTGSFANDHAGQRVDAPKVKFLIKKDAIHVVNISIDEKVKGAGEINLLTSLKIPAKLRAYERSRDGKYLGSSEREVTDLDDGKKNFVEINFKGLKESSSGSSGILGQIYSVISRVNSFKIIREMEVHDNYFSFVLEDGESGSVKRFSFRKFIKEEENTYEPKQAHSEDMLQFGFFVSNRDKIADKFLSKKEDYDKLKVIQRHNPKKDIVYRFSKSTSKEKWVRDIGREAINVWNQAFKKAGHNKSVLLKEDFDVSLGDIRYNVINIVLDDVAQQGSGGVGPSLADPFTGEIIASTANTYIWTPDYYRILRNYLKSKIGAFQSFKNFENTGRASMYNLNSKGISNLEKLFFVMGNGFVDEDERGVAKVRSLYKWANKEQSKVIYAPMIEGADFKGAVVSMGYDVNSSLYGESFSDFYYMIRNEERKSKEALFDLHAFEKTVERSVPNDKEMTLFVRNNCKDLFSFISGVEDGSVKINSPLSTKDENNIVKNCVQKHMALHRYSTVVHEIGHTLGLRHNFMGSSDVENHAEQDYLNFKFMDIGNKHLTAKFWSSVMDYASFSAPGLRLGPGKYDVAALRFGYKSEVELKNGMGFVKVPHETSIVRHLVGQQVKSYKYCTNFHARSAKTNVFCALADQGSTAVELVQREVSALYEGLSRGALRYDRIGVSESISGAVSMNRLREFYEHWRKLVLDEVGLDKQYLQSISYQEYEEIVNNMVSDSHPNQKENKDFLRARNLITNTLLDLVLMPNKYCKVKREDDEEERLLELESLKLEIAAQKDLGEIYGCESDLIKTHLKGKGYELITEVGHHLTGGRFSIDVNKLITTHLDYSGIQPLRMNAAWSLMGRGVVNSKNMLSGFAPSMLDEPDIRELVTGVLFDRFFQGVHVSPKMETGVKKAEVFKSIDLTSRLENGKRFVKYRKESSMLVSLFNIYYENLAPPGDLLEERVRRFSLESSQTNILKSIDRNIYNFYPVSDVHFKFWPKTASLKTRMFQEIKGLDLILNQYEDFENLNEVNDTVDSVKSIFSNLMESKTKKLKDIIIIGLELEGLDKSQMSFTSRYVLSELEKRFEGFLLETQGQLFEKFKVENEEDRIGFLRALFAYSSGKGDGIAPEIKDAIVEAAEEDESESVAIFLPFISSAEDSVKYFDTLSLKLEEGKVESEKLSDEISELKAKKDFLIKIL